MSTVLWSNLLVDGQVTSDQSDKPALHKYADQLDGLSKKLGLGSFLAICDSTDARFNLDDFELPEGMTSTDEVMARDGVWLDGAEAVRLLEGLLAHLRQHPVRFGFLTNDHAEVVSELAEALAFAKSGTPQAAKFNFSIVT